MITKNNKRLKAHPGFSSSSCLGASGQLGEIPPPPITGLAILGGPYGN